MSRIVIVVLIYHRHKLTDLSSPHGNQKCGGANRKLALKLTLKPIKRISKAPPKVMGLGYLLKQRNGVAVKINLIFSINVWRIKK
jgi:hypothetical protein